MTDAPFNLQPQNGSEEAASNPTGLGTGMMPTTPPILSGLPKELGLSDGFSALYMRHITQQAETSPLAQKTREMQAQKAAASQPVEDRPQPAPGSFGDKLQGAVGGISTALGDAAHASDTKGGWLAGVENTLNARNRRIAQEQKDAVLMAKSQAENIALHRNFYQQDEQHRQQFQEANQKFFEQYKESNDLENGVSQEEVFDRMKKDPKFAQNFLVRATGEIPVAGKDGLEKKDEFGNPVMKPTFTVMKVATKDGSDASKTVDADESAAYNKLLGLKFPVGTKLTMAQDNALSIQLAAARDTTNILTKVNGGKDLAPDVMASIRPLLADPTVSHAVSAVPGKPYDGIVQGLKNADDHIAQAQQAAAVAKQQNNQKALDAANAQVAEFQEEKQKLATVRDQAIPDKVVEDYKKRMGEADNNVAEYLNDPSKIQGHAESVIAAADDIINSSKDPAVVAQAQRTKDMAVNVQKAEDLRKVNLAVSEQTAKEKAARIDNNPNGLSGQAYIATLPPGRANLVRAIAEGRLPVNATAFERSTAGKSNPLADDVFAAYPDFNATLGEKWPKAWDQFMISGNDHKKVQAYNVALQHMKNLYDHTTVKGLIPGTDDYNARQVDINYVSREVGNAIAQGVLTQSEGEEIKNSLDSFKAVTPEMKRQRVKETAHLLDAKIQEVQREFEAVRPSANINVPKLLSPAAKSSFDYVLNSGQQATPQQFQGKIGVEAGGKTHYFDTQEQADAFKKLAGIK